MSAQRAPARRAARLNWVDRVVAAFNPQAGVERLRQRTVLAAVSEISADRDLLGLDNLGNRAVRLRDNRTANQVVGASQVKARNAARVLARDNDIVTGIVATRTVNVIGPFGLKVEPLVLDLNGKAHKDFSATLMRLWRDWIKRPEVTGELSWTEVQQKMFAACDVDGEIFAQIVIGTLPTLRHGTLVPMSLELIETDLCPINYNDPQQKIEQGIQYNDWGQPVGYYVYKTPPAGVLSTFVGVPTADGVKRIDATSMIHVANRTRVGQRRGMSILAPVINRLDTIGSAEDAEMDAQALLTRLTAQTTSNDGGVGLAAELMGTGGLSNSGTYATDYGINPGTILQNAPGEKTEAFKTEGTRSDVVKLTDAFLRRVAAGVSVSYSSLSKNYDGTYSAQRQELVEQFPHYLAARNRFANQFVREVWRAFIEAGQLARLIRLPADLDPATLYDLDIRGPAMAWIDPVKEAGAIKELVRCGFQTHSQALRERDISFSDLVAQREAENKAFDDADLRFDSDSRYPAAGPTVKESADTPDPEAADAPTAPDVPTAPAAPGKPKETTP